MKHGYIWLVLRLMGKQKSRTVTVFCGILFSGFLLDAFGRLGYYFWTQVHNGTSETTEFDSTQLVLTILAIVLILLVMLCSVILLHNLFSLTFIQKWNSLRRLMALGAAGKNILFMVLAEISIIYCFAVLLGEISVCLLEKCIHIKSGFPVWMSAGIWIWVFAVSCICGVKPVLYTYRKSLLCDTDITCKSRYRSTKNSCHKTHFAAFMASRYFRVNRRYYIRIILAFTTVFVLYIPVSYLIHTNFHVQQAVLDQKYGIHYHDVPEDHKALEASIKKCQKLAGENTGGDSVIYVRLAGRASVKAKLLSTGLLDVLEKAGWQKQKILESDSSIYFLDDAHYETYLQSCVEVKESGHSSVILVNRYINRVKYREGNFLFPEVDLLNKNADISSIMIASGINEMGEAGGPYIYPEGLASEVPEGIDFTGDVTVILPLSSLKTVRCTGKDIQRFSVHGCFEEHNGTLFHKLQKVAGSDKNGKLVYTRKLFQDWYDSMHEIHLAMTLICGHLFFIAVLNVFCTMIFQYMERKRGLSVLWTLGQTEKGLLHILALENIRSIAISMAAGIPLSCALCYYIYGIFRTVWRINFMLPFEQILLMVTAMMVVSVFVILAEYRLLNRQNFLQNIRDYT